jgi:hypothetical protein
MQRFGGAGFISSASRYGSFLETFVVTELLMRLDRPTFMEHGGSLAWSQKPKWLHFSRS